MIYLTATEHINQQPYAVLIPPYVLDVHDAATAQESPTRIHTTVSQTLVLAQRVKIKTLKMPAPVFEALDQNLRHRAMITINKMVEFSISRTTFTIVEDYDVLVILHQIDAYVEEVYHRLDDKAFSSYVDRLLALRERIYALFRRTLNYHPQWKTAYSHGDDIFGFLLRLYQPLGIRIDTPQSLLDELVLCPTVRAHPDKFATGVTSPPPPSDGRIAYNV
jgi:hypothetical protein